MDISNDEYSENEEDFHFAYEKGNKKRKSIWLAEENRYISKICKELIVIVNLIPTHLVINYYFLINKLFVPNILFSRGFLYCMHNERNKVK